MVKYWGFCMNERKRKRQAGQKKLLWTMSWVLIWKFNVCTSFYYLAMQGQKIKSTVCMAIENKYQSINTINYWFYEK